MIIEHIDPTKLRPHPENAMTHGDAQITQLVSSIEQFGFNGVITIDEENVVLAGHGRRLAAIRSGLQTVPCLRRTGLSEAQKRAYILADNQIGRNSEWDDEVLAKQLDSLLADGFDLAALGISESALASIQSDREPSQKFIRDLEQKTDNAPVTENALEKELADNTAAGLLPIVPIYAEHHEAFIVLCDNTVDEAWLRHKFGLEQPMRSYKDVKIQRANVVTVQQLRDRLS